MSRRGTTNRNVRGSAEDRRRRLAWVMEVYASDIEGRVQCYRCGLLLYAQVVTIDRIVPGAHGGRYTRDNIRPCCAACNSLTGGAVRRM